MAIGNQHVQLLQLFRRVVPPLTFDTYKGQAGRIGVVGGCEEYTGAPIFSSMTALRTGAELVHVFCTKNAAIPIKSFSPDLIVHPILDMNSFSEEIAKWLPRLHALVIGPGLGRDPFVLSNVETLIKSLKNQEKHIPLIVDADGLFLITEKPDLVKNYKNCILTPNAIEFTRLREKLLASNQTKPTVEEDPKLITNILDVNLFKKGNVDAFYSSSVNEKLTCTVDGSPRRCGGQGDLLSGALALCYHWTLQNEHKLLDATEFKNLTSAQIACYAASTLIRTSAKRSFSKLGRSMICADILQEIGVSFRELFEN